MDPAGVGRLRGFRAPDADGGMPSAASPASGQAEILQTSHPPPLRDDRPAKPSTGLRWAVSAAGVLVVAMVIIAALAFRLGSGSATSADEVTPTPTPRATATALPITDVYRLVAPSVVLITTSRGSLGSGVIVNDTGTVLTAHHVISDGGKISILFADGTKAAATVASVRTGPPGGQLAVAASARSRSACWVVFCTTSDGSPANSYL